MFQNLYPIKKITKLNSAITKITFLAPEISRNAKQGQFVNIRIDETSVPLLRRPFSIYYTRGDEVDIVFGVMGMGTKKLNHKKVGDYLDVIGPLGKPFNIDENEEISILIGGGLGTAPLPLLYKKLRDQNKKAFVFLGAKSKSYLLKSYLKNIYISTDDGSEGYSGNVVSLLDNFLSEAPKKKYKIYGCGPAQMLNELKKISKKYDIKCEVSLETMMACGFGICQGCAVKLNNSNNYALSCIDGPVFNINEIEF